jgi:hypothetical protein
MEDEMPKKKFAVYLSAVSNVETKIEVEAYSSEQATEWAIKVAKSGGVVWDYNGVDDSTIEVEEVKDAK